MDKYFAMLEHIDTSFNNVITNDAEVGEESKRFKKLIHLHTELQQNVNISENTDATLSYFSYLSSVVISIFNQLLNDETTTVANVKLHLQTMKSAIKMISNFAILPHISITSNESEPQCNYPLLQFNTDSLLKFCETYELIHEALDEILETIILSLLQICFSQKSASTLSKDTRKSSLAWLNNVTDVWFGEEIILKKVFLIMQKTKIGWIRQKCAFILSQTTIKPSGLPSFFRVINEFTSNETEADWKFCLLVSDLLSSSPKQKNTESYYSLILPQILDMLATDQPPHITFILVNTLQRIYDKNENQPKIDITSVLMAPFHKNDDANSTISLPQLEVAVGIWVKIAEFSSERITFLSQVITECISWLYQLYLETQDSKGLLHKQLHQLLLFHLGSVSTEKAVKYFMNFCGFGTQTECLKCVVKETSIEFFHERNSRDMDRLLQEQDGRVNLITKLLNGTKNKELLGQVFISLIKNFTLPFTSSTSQDNFLLNAEDRVLADFKANEAKLISFALIMYLVENEDPKNLLSHPMQIIAFVKVTLNNWCENGTHEECESVRLCFSVIGLLLLQPLSLLERQQLRDLLSILQKISDLKTAITEEVANLSLEVAMAITTLTTYSSDQKTSKEQGELLKRLNKPNAPKVKEEKKKPLIEEFPLEKHDKIKKNEDSARKSTVKELLSDMENEHPAIVGGAIRQLTELYKLKNKDLLDLEDEFVVILNKCLHSEDSFVYLSAVQAFSVIVINSHRDKMFLTLVDRLRNELIKNDEKDFVIAVKTAEILSRCIPYLGDVAAYYTEMLCNVFLQGMQRPNGLLQASLLSNLVEIITFAPEACHGTKHEISNCLLHLSTPSNPVEVRRSATFGIRRLIEKLQDNFLQVFDENAKDFYRHLKTSYTNDSDATVKLHAQLALECLDLIMKENLFKKTNLTKDIKII